MTNFNFIVKITKNCNLNCSYCYYDKTNGMKEMPQFVLEKVISEALKHNDNEVGFVWHGGEPLLRGISFFEKIIATQKKFINNDQTIVNSIQTNGVLLNEEWVAFLKVNSFRVGISIDGHEDLHNRNRKSKNNSNHFSEIENGLRLCQNKKLGFGLLLVITNYSADKTAEIFKFITSHGISKFDFLPCVVLNNDGTINGNLSLNPKLYKKFLINFFKLWIENGEPNIDIRFFKDTIRGIYNKPQMLCTFLENCHQHLTIETDGKIYFCDRFPQSESNCLGNITDSLNIESNEIYKVFKNKSSRVPKECLSCSCLKICGSGCNFYRYIINPEMDNVSYYCESYKTFFNHVKKLTKEM